MFHSQTLGIQATLLSLTGGHTQIIAAGICRWAVRVDGTFHLGTLKFGITFIALTTSAHGFVVLNTALGIHATVARIAAYTIYTGLITGTIRVRHATAYRNDGLGGLTSATSTADIAIGANTNHSTYG